MYISPQDYKSGVIPFDNLTKPTEAGLEVLHDIYECIYLLK
jgi:hypothetical protein